MLNSDDYSPLYLGDTGTPWSTVFVYKNGLPYDLTGATLSLKLESVPRRVVKIGEGTWSIDDATNGRAHYNWNENDVDTVGNWNMYITILTEAGKIIHPDPKPLTILPAP